MVHNQGHYYEFLMFLTDLMILLKHILVFQLSRDKT